MDINLKKNPISFEKSDGGRELAFPESHALHKNIGDCVIRAITIATEQDYKLVWDELFTIAKENGLFPNHFGVSVKYLEARGWSEVKFGKELVRVNDPKVTELCKNKWIICYIREHWVAMKDNTLHDIWNSSRNSTDEYSRVFRIYTKND